MTATDGTVVPADDTLDDITSLRAMLMAFVGDDQQVRQDVWDILAAIEPRYVAVIRRTLELADKTGAKARSTDEAVRVGQRLGAETGAKLGYQRGLEAGVAQAKSMQAAGASHVEVIRDHANGGRPIQVVETFPDGRTVIKDIEHDASGRVIGLSVTTSTS